MTFRPQFWPTVFTVPALLILIGLGSWQVHRLFWKMDLIETMQRQLSEAPEALPAGDIDPKEWHYRRVKVTGTFDHSREVHLFAHSQYATQGFDIITPLTRSDGKGTVLVNRGWVPKEFKAPETRAAGQVEGEQEIYGIARKPWYKPYSFLPDSNPESNVWLYAELDAMARKMGVENVSPVFVEAGPTPNPGGYPTGGQTRLTVSNRHLSYALTWYGLAAALIVIYVIYHLRRDDGRDLA